MATTHAAAPAARPLRIGLDRSAFVGYAAAFVGVLAVSILVAILLPVVDREDLALMYIPAVLAVAAFFGRGPGVAAAVLGALAFDFLFGDPPYSLAVSGVHEWIGVLVFLATAIVTGGLSAELRRRAREAAQREREATALHGLDRILSAPDDPAAALDGARALLAAELGAEVEVRLGDQTAQPPPEAGRGADVPLSVGGRTLGSLRVGPPMPPGAAAARPAFVAAAAAQIAGAIERGRLRAVATEAETLRRSDDLKTSLVNTVNHEMRTPLAAIKAAAGSLLDDVSPDERRSFARVIEGEVDRLNRVVGNLLDLSRIEGGALRPRKEYHSFGALVDDVVSRLAPLADGHPIGLDVPEDLPPVALDYVQIDQVLTNLVENAFRHTASGTHVRIWARAEPGIVRVSVRDDGPGVAASDLPRLFDKFFRGGSARATGTGLGLAVVKGLVEAHGGAVEAASAPGGGLAVSFSLPTETQERAP